MMLAAAQQRCCSGLLVLARGAARFELQPLNINVSPLACSVDESIKFRFNKNLWKFVS